MNSRTQVGIVGAGPAGLTLSLLLARHGIDSVIVELRDRDYLERRVRAGVLEQNTADVLRELGVGGRMDREGLVHHGIELRFGGTGHRIAMSDLTGGRSVTVYGQQEVVKDLVAARLAAGGPIVFGVSDVTVDRLDGPEPVIRYRADGEDHELICDVVAGCDGFHGVCRPSVPAGVLTYHDRTYPFGWLGVLAAVAPSTEELIYCRHERGFAMHSLRSPSISRLYLQVDPDDDLAHWPDERIWKELHTRLATNDGWRLTEGPVIEKSITPMRAFVTEPMRYGRLFLAGDAAHIVPPTGAKGLNLAVADVRVLAAALAEFYRTGWERGLDAYSDVCLRRVWRVQHFSAFMTAMLHRPPDADPFDEALARSQLDYVTSSVAAATSLAENYVGLPFET